MAEKRRIVKKTTRGDKPIKEKKPEVTQIGINVEGGRATMEEAVKGIVQVLAALKKGDFASNVAVAAMEVLECTAGTATHTSVSGCEVRVNPPKK